jgi:hypothetical protein
MTGFKKPIWRGFSAGVLALGALWLVACPAAANETKLHPSKTRVAFDAQLASKDEIRAYLSGLAYSEKSISSSDVDDLQKTFDALSRQVKLLPSDWRMMIQIAAKGWRFDLIEKYRNDPVAAGLLRTVKLPKLADVPSADGANALWQLNASSNELRRADEKLDRPHQLLVVFHPLCNPCKRLVMDATADKPLHQFMRSCSKWIGTVEGGFDSTLFGAWQMRYPAYAVRFIKDWSVLNMEATYTTPTFLLLRAGVVIDTLQGWPREGGKTDLVGMLQRHGLSLATDCRKASRVGVKTRLVLNHFLEQRRLLGLPVLQGLDG